MVFIPMVEGGNSAKPTALIGFHCNKPIMRPQKLLAAKVIRLNHNFFQN
jgi:hypothetical protein